MRVAALLALSLVAGPAAAEQTDGYRAIGTEPFWSLTIGRDVMRLKELDRRPVAVRTPAARPSFDGLRYVTRRMAVDVTRAPCSDGMSDRVYPDTVTVTVGRRTLRGCGGLALGRR